MVAHAVANLHWSFLSSRLRKHRVNVLFILSHQRSGSSLLVHCLNTNRAVVGYGETFMHYASERDFRRLPFSVMVKTRRLIASNRYVVDKLLYDELLADPGLLLSPRVFAILLIREPAGALRSMINAPKLNGWPQRPEANKDYVDQDNALKYYSSRLRSLEEYARTMNSKRRSFFVTYDDLLNSTGPLFRSLAEFLEVAGSFSEQYGILRTTGRPGYGDVSDNIRRGFVDRNIRRPSCEVMSHVMADASIAFERCCAVLSKHCSVVG